MASVWLRWLTTNSAPAPLPSDHWAQEVRARCKDDQAAVEQSRRDRDAPSYGAAVLGMSMAAVLRHVRRSQPPESDLAAIELQVVEACYSLHAARLQLMAALNTQERIDQLNDLVRGRAEAGLEVGHDRSVVQAMRREVHDGVFQAMADWRAAGQRLTSCAKILPSQLRQDVHWPSALATVRWAGLSRSVGNGLRDAQSHYMECRALLEIARQQHVKALRERAEADRSFTMGAGAGARLSAALTAERAHYAALVETEAMHAIALFRLNFMVLGSAESALA